MSRKIFLTLSCFFALILFSHARSLFTAKTEDRPVESFKKVSLSISAEVILTQENNTSLTLDGDPETIEHIETVVENGTLKIKYDKWRMKNYKRVTIFLSSPDFEGLYVSGSGDITARKTISSTAMDLAVSGSGGIDLNALQSEKVEAKISGSGNINIEGPARASSIEVAISGSGDIDASGLQSEHVAVRISGSGSARVHAITRLEAQISGSGSVYYAGDAQIDARVSGSGKVRSL